jgi:TP901 family phage tail tape measure protein
MADNNLKVGIDASGAKKGARVFKTATGTITKSAGVAARALKGMTSALNPLSMGLNKLKGIFVAGGLGYAVNRSVKTFAEFEKQMAEVHTMLGDGTDKFLPQYTTAVKDLSRDFGESTETMARGLYDILSASVPAEHALEVLEASAKAAAAGLSTTGVAADAITTILNSYALSADKAGEVSDLLFAIVKRGKTTFAELAPNIGKVSAIASVAGLSLEEMGAALATMTRAGVRTEIAITGLKAIINTFLSPTKDSIEAVRRLKLGFDLTADSLKNLGLSGVLAQMRDLSAEDIASIFPNIRAMTGVAPAIKNISGQMEDLAFMTNRAGLTTQAFEKIQATTAFSLGKFKQALKAAVTVVGEGFAPLWVKDANAISEALKKNEKSIKYYARVVAIEVERIQGYFVAFIKFLKEDFSAASDAAWDLFIEGMKMLAKSAGSIGMAAGTAMLEGFKSSIIGGDDFNKAVREQFELRMGKTFSTKGLKGQRIAIQEGLLTPDIFINPEDKAKWDQVAMDVAETWETDTMPTMWSRMEGSLKKHAGVFQAKKKAIFGDMAKDKEGAAFVSDIELANQNAQQQKQEALLDKHGGRLISKWEFYANAIKKYKESISAPGPLGEAAAMGEQWVGEQPIGTGAPAYTPAPYSGQEMADAQEAMQNLNRELELEMETIWLANEARERAIKTREFENAALIAYGGNVEQATEATAEYKDALERLGDVEKFKELAGSIGQSFSTAFESIITQTSSVEDAFRSMAQNIASNIMQKLLFDPIAEMATQFIMKMAMAGMGGGAGAGVAAAVARGGVFSNGMLTPFARGGIVNRPTIFPMANGAGLMGEAGPEAVMPLSRGADGKLGVSAQAAQPDVKVNIVNVTDKNEIANVLASPEGTKVIMNTLRKNRQSTRHLVG